MNIRGFTLEEDKIIKLNYLTMSYEEMAHKATLESNIQRTSLSIKGRMNRLGIRYRRGGEPCSPEEKAYIVKIRPNKDIAVVAYLTNQKFGNNRTNGSINSIYYGALEKERDKIQKKITVKKIAYSPSGKIVLKGRDLISLMIHAGVSAHILGKKVKLNEEIILGMMLNTGVYSSHINQIQQALGE